nr:P-loop guanosine triphosphatase YjiA-like [Nicotiana tomentosiformis]
MASLSIDIATTFMGLAKRQTPPLYGLRTAVFPNLWKTSSSQRASLLSTSSSRILSAINNPTKRNRLSRRFTVSATSTSTPQSEDSDILTKIPPDNRIPATIITGFLGSGKTTLLNHILTADHGKRIAVIENEYGEVDIDGSLVAAKAAGAEEIMMLNNGCLCCTVRGDLVRMIAELVSRKKGKFDHIVIETTGLANPAPIIQTFYAEDQVFNDVKLDGVVTLVDSKHAGFHLDEIKPKGVVNEAVEQIAYADRIIVNKTDLVGEFEVSSLIQRIKSINGMANLKRTQFGKVDLDYVLGIGGFDLERYHFFPFMIVYSFSVHSILPNIMLKYVRCRLVPKADQGSVVGTLRGAGPGESLNLECLPQECCCFSAEHHDHHHSHDHTHDPGVSSVSIVCEGSLDLEKANMWLGTLLIERSDDIYRMKGLLSVQGMDERFVFQGVHDIFQGSPDRPWRSDEPRTNKIVFIGKNLDAKELEEGFKGCLI